MLVDDIALAIDPGITPGAIVHLLDFFTTAEAIFASSVEDMMQTARLNKDTAERIRSKSFHAQAENEVAFARKNKINIVTALSPEYPRALLECPDRPHVLYIKGEADLNEGRWLSVVGTRSMTSYGKRICEEMIADMARMFPDAVIVSGLAYGVDVIANLAALDNNLKTVAVMGQPMTHIYPSQHTSIAKRIVDSGGVLISEYHSGHVSHRNDFVARNRIIAGLSEGTVVVESAVKGGSLYTADMADGYNRTAMAVPGRATDKYSAGTNRLIRSMKAQMVCSAEDIADILGWETEITEKEGTPTGDIKAALGSAAKNVLSVLNNDMGTSLDNIVSLTGLELQDVSAALLDLELEGIIDALPGKLYIIT